MEEEKARHLERWQDLEQKLTHRIRRLDQSNINFAVIGLENQGKSTFVNSWIECDLLPTDNKRCTWASTTIVNDPERSWADIVFYNETNMKSLIKSLVNSLPESLSKQLSTGLPLSKEQARIIEEQLGSGSVHKNFLAELQGLNEAWPMILQKFNEQSPLPLVHDSTEELLADLRQYISLVDSSGKKQTLPYAVERVSVHIPLEKDLSFQIDDLPGLNAPGNRAELATWDALNKRADVIVMVKDAEANSSLVNDEINVHKSGSAG